MYFLHMHAHFVIAKNKYWLCRFQNKKKKNLSGSKLSLAPDLPPKVRQMKNAVMLHRKSLEEEARKKSKVRYLAQWPFVELKLDDKNTFRPPVALEQIVGDVLGIRTMFKLAIE